MSNDNERETVRIKRDGGEGSARGDTALVCAVKLVQRVSERSRESGYGELCVLDRECSRNISDETTCGRRSRSAKQVEEEEEVILWCRDNSTYSYISFINSMIKLCRE